jgi:branched-chain amino acid:cation transporter, LIVCS family
MKRLFQSHIVTTGLAIFSMLFGAGNLIYPLMVGVSSGSSVLLGMTSFFITAVFLPVLGLIAMILFDGDYEAFFARLGTTVGKLFIFICMIIIGPGLVIPRIVTLSHLMTAPFLPGFLQEITLLSSCAFSVLFLGITFLCTYKENKIVDLLGNIISPLLLVSLAIIIIKGLWIGGTAVVTTIPARMIITKNLLRGYETLDLLGAIFFASIILVILQRTLPAQLDTKKNRVLIGLQSGMLGVSLLALVYLGMGYLGAYFGQDLAVNGGGEIFRIISWRILGDKGAFVIAMAVLMACLSTAIGLAGVTGEYLQKETFAHTISYIQALVLTLVLSIPLSTFGLDHVLRLTAGPITYIGYPVIIALTLCNIAYKFYGFKPVKLPVLITFMVACISYFS